MLTKALGAVMATRPASMPLHIIDGSGFSPRTNISQNMQPKRRGRAGQHRVDHDERNSQVGAGQGRARIKPEPTEGQNERADANHRNVVARNRPRLAVDVLADARADQ